MPDLAAQSHAELPYSVEESPLLGDDLRLDYN